MKLSNLKLSTSRSPSSNLQSANKKQWSTYQLYTMRKSVDEKGRLNLGVREQLVCLKVYVQKMQRQSSQKILSRIQSSMLQTQQNAVDFLSRYEQQKCKNVTIFLYPIQQQLQKLVSHYEKEIQQQKRQRFSNVIQNIQNNEYDQLKKIQKQRQKQLQTVTNKLNSSQCQKNIKYQVVKAQRRQRILYSNQFDKFQGEIFDLQYKYKQFLIERVLLERQFEEKQLQLAKTKAELERQLRSYQEESRQIYQQQVTNYKNNTRQSQFVDTQGTNYYSMGNTLTNMNKNKQSFYKSRAKMNYNSRMQRNQLTTRNQLNQINEKKLNNLQTLKIVKQLLNQLGMGSFYQLKNSLKSINIGDDDQQKTQKIFQNNEKKTQQILKLQDEIYEWTKQIDSLQYDIEHRQQSLINKQFDIKKKSHLKTKRNKQQQTKQMIDQLNEKINQQNQTIKNFNTSQQFLALVNFLQIDSKKFDDLNQGNNNQSQTTIDIDLLAQIQQKFTQIVGNSNDFKSQFRAKNDRRSIVCWQMPHLQHQQRDSNVGFTQKSICPLLQPTKSHNPKRMKTGISQQVAGPNGLKKLTNLLKNQSRMRGPIDIVSKDQMIKQASQAFDKQGLSKIEKFQVKYT